MKLNLSLKQKLIFSISLLVAVPLLIYGWITYNREVNNIRTGVMEQEEAIVNQLVERVEETMVSQMELLEVTAGIGEVVSMEPEQQEGTLEDIQRGNPIFELLFVLDQDGTLIAHGSESEENEALIGGDFSDRDYFQAAIKGDHFFSDSMISRQTDLPTSSLAVPIEEDGEQVGVLAATVSFAELQQIIDDFSEEDEFAYITDSEGTLVAHPDYERVLAQDNIGEANEVVAEALEGRSGVGEYYNTQGVEMLGAYAPVDQLDWVVVAQATTESAFSQVDNILWQTILILVIAIIIAIIVALFIANNFSKPIQELVTKMREVGQGNLKARVDIDRSDEIGELADNFNRMVTEEAEIVADIIDVTETLASSGEELSALAEEASGNVETTAGNMQQMSAGIEEVSATTEKINDFAEETAVSAEEGQVKIEEAVSEMESIKETVTKAVESINDLGDSSDQIGQIIELITNIAEQTNLLALNAAIEAARAGEHGQGFAVVAEEIRQLAEETTAATDKISGLVKQTQSEADNAISAVKTGADEVEQGEEVINQAGVAFNQIVEEINNTTAQLQDTTAVIQQLATGSDEVVKATDEITKVTDEVTSSSLDLTELAEELNQLVNKFEI
ncbi:methyl-accepting chemotaxis protein [Natroniella sulfidigena]|uniref:methyl-accepting chemotaxis protein n=1 Tax=Natroniella sulfidigena TaxID=723921 RepID=UPI00200B1AA4|nr:methyl-accepting chemotaxis protein [Natroniella sulfidigena]MCK8817223.1 methyl-accepting chemotaxis protein [Natroniella sulfidigena]